MEARLFIVLLLVERLYDRGVIIFILGRKEARCSSRVMLKLCRVGEQVEEDHKVMVKIGQEGGNNLKTLMMLILLSCL